MVLPTEMTLINDDMIGYLKVPLGNYAVLLRILQDLHVFCVKFWGEKCAEIGVGMDSKHLLL